MYDRVKRTDHHKTVAEQGKPRAVEHTVVRTVKGNDKEPLGMRETLALMCTCWDDPRGIMRMFEQETIEDFDMLYFFDGKFSDWEGVPEFPVNETRDIVTDFGATH